MQTDVEAYMPHTQGYGFRKKRGGNDMLGVKKIGVIGGGNMGSALIGGILSSGLLPSSNLFVSDVDENRLEYLKKTYGVVTTVNNREVAAVSDILILAVKPQNMAEVLEELRPVVDSNKLIISIAAGISTHYIEGHLDKGVRVVRVMPNTPALIGEGATAITRGTCATDDDLASAGHIFDAVGLTVFVKEELMDVVTALSGSGPAYVFVIIDALSDAGVYLGLNRDVALKLAAKTLLGAAKLCLQGDKHPAQLRDMVTSPGGTTIAGLKALEDGKIRAILMNAVEAAAARAKLLGKKE